MATKEFAVSTAPHSIKFEYWAMWVGEPKVTAALELIEQRMPGQFSCYLYVDEGRTGRFEVTCFKNQNQSVEGDSGTNVWSKAAKNCLPGDDPDAFIAALMEACKWTSWVDACSEYLSWLASTFL